MIVLAITTSGPVEAAVSVGADDVAAGQPREAAVAGNGQALATLLDCITAALAELQLALVDVNGIAVCIGPGSFTGLRIGVAFAKGLAQARDLPCVGVSAYDVAEAGSRALFPRAAIVAGKRGYFYARLRSAADGTARFEHGDASVISSAIAALAHESGRPVALHGDCDAVPDRQVAIVAGSFRSRAPGKRASAVAQLGRAQLTRGDGDWRRLAIDYGQRPNAAINWETRRVRR